MKPTLSELYGPTFLARAPDRLQVPSLRKTVRHAWRSLRLRWRRSLIASACVAGAIAFLSYTLLAWGEWSDGSQPLSGVSRLEETEAGDFFAGLEQFTADQQAAQKRLFTVILSLLVAFVGISNALLMAVKERYREIATLKCLGAVNGYIQRLFLMEAVMQGAAGSLAGTIGGMFLHLITRAKPASADWILLAGTGSFLLGMVLTLIGSIGPIRAALAMMPVEALRVEE